MRQRIAAGLVMAALSCGTQKSAAQTSSAPIPIIRSVTRLVNVEVVAKDRQGHPVEGLSRSDFEVFEQIAPKRDQRPQRISGFRSVSVTDLAAQDKGAWSFPAGVYSNIVTMHQVPVPPTVLLVDGINTDFDSQGRIRTQMVKMLSSIPSDIPVAVFFLGLRLRMVQNFTSDPKLLQAALGQTTGDATPRSPIMTVDDPDPLSAFKPTSGYDIEEVQRFESEVFRVTVDDRVQKTLDALRSLARHLAGYPGRKNLIWISSSFPILLSPSEHGTSGRTWAGFRNYEPAVAETTNALASAQVAVYPVDPAGLKAPLPGHDVSNVGEIAMFQLAEQTGGKVCLHDNDLGDCIKKTVADSSSFYEISYYPDSSNWSGEFHRILIKANKPGVELGYRHGYYAGSSSEGKKDKEQHEIDLQRAACVDLITSTSLLLGARVMPPPQQGQAEYFLSVDLGSLSLPPKDDGSRQVSLTTAVCTFDRGGRPLQYLEQPVERALSESEFRALQARGGFPHQIVLKPAAGTVAVRLLVKDTATGKLGSVNVPYAAMAAVHSPASPDPSSDAGKR